MIALLCNGSSVNLQITSEKGNGHPSGQRERERERLLLLLSSVQYGQVNYCGQSLIGSVHVNKSFVSYSVDVFVVIFARPLARTAIVGSEERPPLLSRI